MDEQPQENINQEEQLPTPPLDDSRNKPLQSNKTLLTGIVIVLGVLVAVGAGVYFLFKPILSIDLLFDFPRDGVPEGVIYAREESWGPCPSPEDNCYLKTYLYQSGELTIEGWEYANVQLTQEAIDRIIEVIKQTDVINTSCSGSQMEDYWATYTINVEGKTKKIHYPGCENELERINQVIEEEKTKAGDTSIGAPSWQTYRNEEYGFEVRYPDNVFAMAPVTQSATPAPDSRNIKYDGVKLVSPDAIDRIGVDKCIYYERERLCTAETEDGIAFIPIARSPTAVKEEILSSGIAELFTPSYTTIAGRDVLYILEAVDGIGAEYYFIPLSENTTLVVARNFGGWPSFQSKPSKFIDQILSTFKFIE